jgi:hypothetical protein
VGFSRCILSSVVIPPELLRTLDELVRKDFQHLRDFYFACLLISSGIVAIGVLMEGPEAFHEVWDEIRERRRKQNTQQSDGPVREPGESFSLIKLLSLVGWLLVVVGVVGEGVCEGLVSQADGLLQTLNDTLLVSASDRASNAEVTAKAFEFEIADAVARAEEERHETERLRTLVAPRSLDLDEQRRIVDSLRKFIGHPAVVVTSYGLDGEAAALGTQIISVINIATGVMPIDQRANFISTGGFEVGIQIRGPNSESGFMEVLTTGLTSIGHLKEVRVNGPSIRPMLAGPVTVGGPATMSGGVSTIAANIPAAGPVSIMIAVKPLPVITAR